MPSATRRCSTFDNTRGQVDETAPARRDDANYQWGLVANLAARVDAEAPGARRFPGLIIAASLSLPNMEVAEEGAKLLAAAASFGLQPGIADADMQYFANALPDRLLRPALDLGYTPSTDVRKDRLGVKGGAHGLLFVEGDAYCPSTPKALLTASIDFREGRIDLATFRARIEERKHYRAHVKEKAKAGATNIGQRRNGGKAMLRWPAAGPSPTVTCPLREMFMGAAKKARPEVEPETLEEEFLDKICTQHSVSVDLTEMMAPQQAFDYGTEEWDEFHGHARNTIESRNEQLKASGDEDIETGGRRRVRGLAAAQMIVTMLLVNFNIRKIAAFLNDKAREEARTTPKPRTLRRRDRVWKNRYVDTKGNGDLTIRRPARSNSLRSDDPTPATAPHPLRT